MSIFTQFNYIEWTTAEALYESERGQSRKNWVDLGESEKAAWLDRSRRFIKTLINKELDVAKRSKRKQRGE